MYGNLTVKLKSGKELPSPSNNFISSNDSISLFKAVLNKRRELSNTGDYISYFIEGEEVSTILFRLDYKWAKWKIGGLH